jgi:hypothetical protein
VRVDVLVFVDV